MRSTQRVSFRFSLVWPLFIRSQFSLVLALSLSFPVRVHAHACGVFWAMFVFTSYSLVFLCVLFVSMSDSISPERVNELVRNLDRPAILKALGLEESLLRFGDFIDLRPIDVESSAACAVHEVNAPLLGVSKGDCCAGAKLYRADRTTVAVP